MGVMSEVARVVVDRRRGGDGVGMRGEVWLGLSELERDRVRVVVERVLAGYGVDEVAVELGLSVEQVERLLVLGLDGLVGRLADYVEERLRLQLVRLDRLFRVVYPKALEGDMGAVKRAVEILQRESALLGLDAAQKRVVEHRLTAGERAASLIFGGLGEVGLESRGLPEWYVEAEVVDSASVLEVGRVDEVGVVGGVGRVDGGEGVDGMDGVDGGDGE